jgi:pilus assembly protein CpaB
VDIIITAKDPQTHEKVAATTLQNIPVLATGRMTTSTNMATLKDNEKEYQTLSVMVLPEEVDILALMRNRASYRLVLRNDQDYDPFEGGHSSPSTLLEGRRNQALQKKRFETIQMIRHGVDDKSSRGR